MDFCYKYTDNSTEGYIDDYSDNSHNVTIVLSMAL